MSTKDFDRRMMMVGVATVGAALVVVFSANRTPDHTLVVDEHASAEADVASGALRATPSYSELRDVRRGPNAWMYLDGLASLTNLRPTTLEPTEAEVDEMRSLRRSRRAFDGAPPTVPHVITQRTQDCLACHARGAVIDGRVAPKLSHEPYPSCTQCHVSTLSGAGGDPPETVSQQSGFEAHWYASEGVRAWPGAPPQMPHPTRMREDCLSCHGPTARAGLATSHPERLHCVQCHAAPSSLNQRSSR